MVPRGFEAYARLLHPAESDQGEVLRWAEVAAWSGVELGRGTQFHEIALPQHTPSSPAPWDDGAPPVESTLTAGDAASLVEALRGHTTTPEDCWFCVWDGFGWDTGTTAVSYQPGETAVSLPPDSPPSDPVPTAVRTGPRVRVPGRDYLLYTGPVEAAAALLPETGQTPNLWWPADHSWVVATDLDLIETYLAGSRPLIEQVLTEPGLEALPAHPDDTITLQLRGWQAELVETATAELLASGRATLTTSRGSAHASLWRPTPSQSGELALTYGPETSYRSSRSWFDHTDEDELRRHARFALTDAVTKLAEG